MRSIWSENSKFVVSSSVFFIEFCGFKMKRAGIKTNGSEGPSGFDAKKVDKS